MGTRTFGHYEPPRPARELTAISADGARLHVEVHGEATHPAVVLAHGWTCSTAFWGAVIRELTAAGHRVVVYDQRGHGRSPGTARTAPYGPEVLADDLCAVLEAALAPGEQAVIGGHSMGAMTIIAAAGRPTLRQRAAAVMLCSTGARGLTVASQVVPVSSDALRDRLHRIILLASLPLGPVTPLSKKVLKYGTMGVSSTPEQIGFIARTVHACPARERAAWGKVLARLDILAQAADLDVPTAVVAGDSDRLTPFRLVEEIAEKLSKCVELKKLPGRGHMTPVESSAEISGTLAGLVRDHLAVGRAGSGTEEKEGTL
jgi:pimeloyl-ACP methyl ester carboxylesterase